MSSPTANEGYSLEPEHTIQPTAMSTLAARSPTDITSTPLSSTNARTSQIAPESSKSPQSEMSNPFSDVSEPSPIHSTNDLTAPRPAQSVVDGPQHAQHAASLTTTNARTASLKAMFPDFDDVILNDVLSQCNGSEDQAVDVLLGMTDPNHTPASRPRVPTQTELDAQLAERLMLEDHQAIADSEAYDERMAIDPNNLPYQPRRRSSQGRGRGINSEPGLHSNYRDFVVPGGGRGGQRVGNETSPSAGGPDFQDQFNKFADSGKKTLNNIFGRIKTKIAQMDSGRSQAGGPSDSGRAYERPVSSQSLLEHDRPETSPTSPGSAPPQQSQSPAGGGSRRSKWSFQPGPQDAAADATSQPIGGSLVPEPKPSSVNASNGQAPPPAAANIDRTKIGLLPKKTVSLAGKPPSTNEAAVQSRPSWQDEEDDDLYSPNPTPK